MVNFKEIHPTYIEVRLNKKKVGKILRVAGGFQYRPNKSKVYGEVYPTIDKCKESLL